MRLRREPELDPDTIRELEALDAALAGHAVAPRDEELASLAVALRDERPQPRPEFALDLDLRAREGFETTARASRAVRGGARRPSRRSWGLALGAAASLFIVATGVIGSGVLDSGNGEGKPGGTTVAPAPLEASPESRDSAPSAAGGGTAPAPDLLQPSTASPAPPSGGDIAATVRDRKVERGASLTLAPPRDQIEEVADDAIEVTDQHGGFVLRSVVTGGEGRDAGAALELRIPSAELQPALADLSKLAHVRARTQQTTDITGAFTSPRRRLADALAERRALLRQLARAVTPNETAAVRARLRAVNRRIDRAQAELRRLRQRVSLSAVTLAIEPGSGKSADGGGWSIGDAVDDALSVLRTMLGAALVALAVLIPASLLGGLAWLTYSGWLRRRRESALEM